MNQTMSDAVYDLAQDWIDSAARSSALAVLMRLAPDARPWIMVGGAERIYSVRGVTPGGSILIAGGAHVSPSACRLLTEEEEVAVQRYHTTRMGQRKKEGVRITTVFDRVRLIHNPKR